MQCYMHGLFVFFYAFLFTCMHACIYCIGTGTKSSGNDSEQPPSYGEASNVTRKESQRLYIAQYMGGSKGTSVL